MWQANTQRFQISSATGNEYQTELLSALLPQSPNKVIEVVTEQYLRSNQIHRFKWGSEADVFTREGWPFVMKIFQDDPENDIWSLNTLKSYRIAKASCAGLIADFSFCGYSGTCLSGSLEPAVVMRKVELGRVKQ